MEIFKKDFKTGIFKGTSRLLCLKELQEEGIKRDFQTGIFKGTSRLGYLKEFLAEDN